MLTVESIPVSLAKSGVMVQWYYFKKLLCHQSFQSIGVTHLDGFLLFSLSLCCGSCNFLTLWSIFSRKVT